MYKSKGRKCGYGRKKGQVHEGRGSFTNRGARVCDTHLQMWIHMKKEKYKWSYLITEIDELVVMVL